MSGSLALTRSSLVVSESELTALEGKHIRDICPNGYDDDSHNHCAHFVSHVFDLTFGYTCKAATSGSGEAANLRVHEVFAQCPLVGPWDEMPLVLICCLAFVTYKTGVNIKKHTMTNQPKKHIGIYLNGNIWHYSNARTKVWKEDPATFAQHYPGTGFAMFYGTLPI